MLHGQLTLEKTDCFDKLCDVMKCIGDHLNKLPDYATTGIPSEKVQEVRKLY